MEDGHTSAGKAAAFEQYRVLLFSIAYRMTGSASDAEDLVQETYLRYHGSAEREIASLKAYLSTIITRLALDHLKSARMARERYVGTWLPEPILTSAEGSLPLASLEQQEALSLAFLRLLEALSPPERAVFLLHEVFGYPFGEIAAMLEKSPANCRQIFHHARTALEGAPARFTPEPQQQRQLLLSFLAASQAGDMAALTRLLAHDAISWADGGGKAPANLKPVVGQAAVARFWAFWLGQASTLTFTLGDVNGEVAILAWEGERLGALISLALGADGVREIAAQLNPEKLAYIQAQLAQR